jgi:hypothetical protein
LLRLADEERQARLHPKYGARPVWLTFAQMHGSERPPFLSRSTEGKVAPLFSRVGTMAR